MMFGDPTFANADEARRAWPTVRRAVWRETLRFSVPRAAQTFDGLTIDSAEQTRASWNHVHFPLGMCLEALAVDRRNLEAFVTSDPAGAAAIGDILAEVRADLDLAEAAARALTADAGPFYLRGYPHALSSSAYYSVGNGRTITRASRDSRQKLQHSNSNSTRSKRGRSG